MARGGLAREYAKIEIWKPPHRYVGGQCGLERLAIEIAPGRRPAGRRKTRLRGFGSGPCASVRAGGRRSRASWPQTIQARF